MLSVLFIGGARAQSQREMNASAAGDLQAVEAQLQSAVAAYRARLGASQRNAFDESQRRWAAYRKAACDFQATGVAGGSVEPLVRTLCLQDYAVERFQRVDYLLKCEERDLSCPAFKPGT